MLSEKDSRIKYVRMKDIFACLIMLFMMPIALIAKMFIHNFWLVGEERREARDNGYWFFKYVREHYKTQKIAYVIDKKCADYQKVKGLGKVIQWGSLAHWFWYLTAKKNISSQKGCKPNAAACYFFEITLRIWRNKRYFLQHGVIINDLKWLYCNQSRFKLFICSAKQEYEFVKNNFGYPEKAVKCLGLCRFDGLHDAQCKENLILVMPTWRGYLVRPHGTTSKNDLKKAFVSTNYFKNWAQFLTSPVLGDILKDNQCELLFYPHRNMQIYLDEFNKLNLANNIKIANPDCLSVQQALKDAKYLITDYSSIFADFAYMKKPIIFYQFDEKEFRENQYREGYFDYRKNNLGKWCDNLDDCLHLLKESIDNQFSNDDSIETFFEYYDNKNCERNYQAVKNN